MRYLLFLAFCAVCRAASTPPATPAPFRCGEIPDKCEKLTCAFQKARWMSGGAVDAQKLGEYLDTYARQHAEWAPAAARAKAACLGALPAQGVLTDCPAYDVTHCLQMTFARNAQAGQWASSADCEYARQFVAHCPFCPSDCYAPQIPIGSCNACLSWPTKQ